MIRKKQDVLKSIRQMPRKVGDLSLIYFEAYLGTRSDGSKIRIARSSMAQLQEAISDFYKTARSGDDTSRLKNTQISDAIAALSIIEHAGLSVTLSECARFYVDGSGRPDASKLRSGTLGDAFSAYLEGIPEIKDLHKKAVRARVGKFVETIGYDKDPSAVTELALEEYMKGKDNITTYNNIVGYIKTFAKWMFEKKYTSENSLDPVKLKDVPYSEPEFMKADDVKKIARLLEAHGNKTLIAYFALCFFVGIRVEEIKRIAQSPDDLRIDDGTIRVSKVKGWTTGRPPRLIHLPENAIQWLKSCNAKETIVLLPAHPRRQILQIMKDAGLDVEMPNNAGRHTFITMHYAAFGDWGKTISICGTSKGMMMSHYAGLTTKLEGNTFMSIMPS